MSQYHTDERAQELAYDEVPYESHPFSQSQPARLAAAAHLLGLTPPIVRTARVLEIGCAAGGNLIPLAAYYPEATFVGIDISGKQINDGLDHIAALQLPNIELRKGSITEITPADGLYDYIICHGVYSWVSAEIREAILQVCAANVAPQGIVYISYNVYPGWHTKQIVRDLMTFHTEGISNPSNKILSARSILETVQKHASGAYGSVLATEQSFIQLSSDDYIRHESLADENNPCYFKDFVHDIRQHGLEYLCEADLPFTALQSCSPIMANQIRQLAGNDYIKIQQYIDFFLGRSFRMSLIVKQDNARSINRSIKPERVEQLHVTYRNTIVQNYPQPETAAEQFESGFRLFANDHDAITVESPPMIRVLELIRDSTITHPASFSFEELVRHAAAGADPTVADRQAVAKLILEMIRRKMLWFTTEPLHCSPVSATPKGYDIVLDDAAYGRSMTTNILHDRISFSYPASAQFLALLDGTRDHDALRDTVYNLVIGGKMKLESALAPFDRMPDVRQAVQLYVARTLEQMAKLKLLAP